MKKAIQVNIHDRIFYIDEDAYNLLQKYLQQLSLTFPDAEGKEIVADIETRIAELFDERRDQGYNVIDIDYVNTVIDTVGRPEDLTDDAYATDEEKKAQTPPPYHKEANSDANQTPKKKLYRDVDNKIFGGVISGLAKYMGWDVTILRVLAVVVTIFTYFWPMVIMYLVAWMVLPPADTPRRRLEMEGREVTVDNIGKKVKDDHKENPKKPSAGFGEALGTIVGLICKIILAVIGLIAAVVCIGLAITFLFFVFFIAALALLGIDQMGMALSCSLDSAVWLQCLWCLLLTFGVLIIFGSLLWAACSVLFNWRKTSTAVWITLLVILILLAGSATLVYFRLQALGCELVPF